MSTAAVIAGHLSRVHGFDFEIAHIFALEAQARGRLTTCETLTEAVAVVADMLCPAGVFMNTACAPRRIVESVGNKTNHATKSPGLRSQVNHRSVNADTGSWLVT